jgi:hypothetical protein
MRENNYIYEASGSRKIIKPYPYVGVMEIKWLNI